MDETTQATPILTNEFELTEELLREAFQASFRTDWWIAPILLHFAAWVIGVLMVSSDLINQSPLPVLLLSVAYLVFVIIWTIERFLLRPGRQAKQHIQQDKEKYGIEKVIALARFEEGRIDFTTKDAPQDHQQPSYEHVVRILQTEHLILLFTKGKMMYFLGSSGFQNGTEEDFWRLIAEKCPEAKRKRR